MRTLWPNAGAAARWHGMWPNAGAVVRWHGMRPDAGAVARCNVHDDRMLRVALIAITPVAWVQAVNPRSWAGYDVSWPMSWGRCAGVGVSPWLNR